MATTAKTRSSLWFVLMLAVSAMSNDDKLIDFAAERDKRIHDLNDKRLNEMRQVFEQVLPLGKGRKKSKSKPKKR